jgi:heat shock protein HtpX
VTSRVSNSERADPLEAYQARVKRLIVAVVAVIVSLAVVLGVIVKWLVSALTDSSAVGLVGAVTVSVAVVVAMLVRLRRWPGDQILQRMNARHFADSDSPRVRNLVDGLCLRSGVDVPRLWLVDAASANAMVLGGAASQRSLVFTVGLLDRLDRVELEAVAAWLIARLRSGEADSALRLIGLVGAYRLPTGLAETMQSWSGARDLIVYHDEMACGLTRYPPGLVSALERVGEGDPSELGEVTPLARPDEAHLWFVPPTGSDRLGDRGRIHDMPTTLAERISHTRDL